MATSRLRVPAPFRWTRTEQSQCEAPLMPGTQMYLTPLGSSMVGGQWGAWQLTDDPSAPTTGSWRLNFMSKDWQTIRISSSSGNLSSTVKPTTIDELRGTYQWLPEDPGVLGLSSWSFVEDLLAPSVALHYANLNYSVAQDPNSFPPTFTGSPSLAASSALAPAEWQYWSVADCKDVLMAVFAIEVTNGTKPGRSMIYNAYGQKASEVVPDALMARYSFVDVNQRLLATAEAPTLGSNLPLSDVPKRPNLGNILPYSISFEQGGYDFSSDLLKKEFRWILSAAVQARALQDANYGFTPLFIRDNYFLLAVAVALALILALVMGTIFAGSLRTAGRIFFHRDKTPGSPPLFARDFP